MAPGVSQQKNKILIGHTALGCRMLTKTPKPGGSYKCSARVLTYSKTRQSPSFHYSGDCLRWAGAIGFLILLGKDLRFIFNALYLYIIMYMNLRALWLLSVLRNYATI